ncbi:FixH family protein [Paenibacillus sp.]|uniref:FixH family protein n=1 Tax=Paenibacillus sp. TaxID=58172 RepID=UPI0028B1D0EC|nr:FixH family protein [Paenibacillus sp.]
MKISRTIVPLLLGATLLVLGGCSSDQTKHSGIHNMNMNMSMEPIKVELHWSPEEVVVNQKVTFEAVVTQDNSAVDDAKEVLFEIVNKDDDGQKIELKGKLVGDGIYQAEGTLAKEGQYIVTSHVTARTQHSMPNKELSVKP